MLDYGYDYDYKSLNERVHVLVLALAPVSADFAAADVNSAKSVAVD